MFVITVNLFFLTFQASYATSQYPQGLPPQNECNTKVYTRMVCIRITFIQVHNQDYFT